MDNAAVFSGYMPSKCLTPPEREVKDCVASQYAKMAQISHVHELVSSKYRKYGW